MKELNKKDYDLILSVLLNPKAKLDDVDKAHLDIIKLKLLYKSTSHE